MSQNFFLKKRPPEIEEYRALCTAVGWQDVINFEAAKTSLKNSVFGVTIFEGDKPIGMGRIVGDGAIYYYIQDVAVDPAYQGKGIGTVVMEGLLDYIRENAPDQAFVGIFAAADAMKLYERYGFKVRDLTGIFNVTPL